MTQHDPRTEYLSRLQERRLSWSHHDRLDRNIGSFRFVIFGAATLLTWLSFVSGSLSPWWLLVPSVVFSSLVVVHERVMRTRRRLERSITFYELGIARLEDRWAGRGEKGLRFQNSSHPYAEDLDLFGEGSLFELLCTARTRMGEDKLAAWLRSPALPDDIRSRQASVIDLRSRIDLREDLAVLGADVRSGVHPEALSAWSIGPSVLVSRPARIITAVLALLTTATVFLWASSVLGRWEAILALAVQGSFALWFRARVLRVIAAVERPARDLSLLSQVLARFERESFTSRRLIELRETLQTNDLPSSRQIARLNRLVVLLDSRRNQLFALLAYLLLWGTQFALAIESWRKTSGTAVPRWLEAVGEIEALCGLAGYAYEHPEDPFPDLVEGVGFEGEDLGHPLIPGDRCVRNNVRLGKDLRVLMVSGSNMSGKSTLLRTVGSNVVLALAGAPVRARKVVLSPLALGASIRIMDSLQEGSSRFYAEINRLRKLVDLTKGEIPLFFLLDELLQGTNSHDRLIGSKSVVKGLVDRGAIGLVTTHDLALSQIVSDLAPLASNIHFEDHIENGKMAFDYRIRPGIVQKSNALELMRSVGLEV